MTTNNDALREALEIVDAQANDEGLWFHAATAPEGYLQAALRELHAKVEALAASKPEPQAQEAEQIKGYLYLKPPFEDENGEDISGEYITLQSHREAMADLRRHKEDWKSSCFAFKEQRNALQEAIAELTVKWTSESEEVQRLLLKLEDAGHAIAAKDAALQEKAMQYVALFGELQDAREEIAKLHTALDALTTAAKDMKRHYCNALENARDRIIFLGGDCDSLEDMLKGDPYITNLDAAIIKAQEARK